MRAITLMTAQVVSLFILIASANRLFEETKSTFAFALSFIAFAACSIYIGNHQKELLKEVDREYGA
ncbi:MAG: hypothetical protein IJY64_00170 [Bacteroidaceae bacterium]|nr:hypothetical protein [Bacteroidaceae bacterium]MBQ8449326.1 hypothetical protein [Bacteroidaceae bacterium]